MKVVNSCIRTDQKHNESLEIISVRLYNPDDRIRVIDGVNQLTPQLPGDYHFSLFYNPVILGEWALHIRRSDQYNSHKKSDHGLCLCEIFREIGIVNHIILEPFSLKEIKSGKLD